MMKSLRTWLWMQVRDHVPLVLVTAMFLSLLFGSYLFITVQDGGEGSMVRAELGWYSQNWTYRVAKTITGVGDAGGTINVTNGGRQIDGTGTSFADWARGDEIQLPDAGWYVVDNVSTSTALNITISYPSSNLTGQSYDMRHRNVQARITLRYSANHSLTEWIRDTVNNPLFEPPQQYRWPAAVYNAGTYYIYLGGPVSGTETQMWTSTDGVVFTNQGIVVQLGANGTWDDDMLEPHSVIWWAPSNHWRLYYGGYNGTTWKVGYAYSSNLTGWTKYASNPVLGPTGGETQAADPHAVVYNDTVYLYYADTDVTWNLHGSYSSDGNSFTKFGSNPLKNNYAPGAVLPFDDGMVMLGKNLSDFTVDSKWSTDGEVFSDYSGNPVFSPSIASGEFDDTRIDHLAVVKVGSTYVMYYAGYNGSIWKIGRALATEDVILGGNGKTDFGDVRFTRSDGETELDYWMREKVDSDYAVFMVELDMVPKSGETNTTYIYYGNAAASTTSDIKGASLYDHADDFNDNSRDASLWDVFSIGTGSSNETNQRLEITASANGDMAGYVSVNVVRMHDLLLRVSASSANLRSITIWLAPTKVTGTNPFLEDDWYRVMLYNPGINNFIYVQRNVGGGGSSTLYTSTFLAAEEELIIAVEDGQVRFYEGSLDVLRYTDSWPFTSRDCYIYLIGDGTAAYLGTDWEDTFWIQKQIGDFENIEVWGDLGSQEGYVSISNFPPSYGFGSVGASGNFATNMTYFTVTNDGGVSVDVSIGGTNMTGGTPWTLSDTPAPGGDIYAINAGIGGDYDIIIKLTSPFNNLVANLGTNTSQAWGLNLYTPTSFSDGELKTGKITITAVEA